MKRHGRDKCFRRKRTVGERTSNPLPRRAGDLLPIAVFEGEYQPTTRSAVQKCRTGPDPRAGHTHTTVADQVAFCCARKRSGAAIANRAADKRRIAPAKSA